jgi:hypothetical protein
MAATASPGAAWNNISSRKSADGIIGVPHQASPRLDGLNANYPFDGLNANYP